MILLNQRLLNLAGFLCCAGLMGFALYAQHVLLLDPCPLCVFQRVAVISIGIVFLIVALHDPSRWGRRVYSVFLALFAAGGAGVAAWHVRLQNLPASEVPACGPGLDYMLENFPVGDDELLNGRRAGFRKPGMKIACWQFEILRCYTVKTITSIFIDPG